PLDRERARWTDRRDYRACQDLAEGARAAGVEILRYESARGRSSPLATNVALLTCRAFVSRRPGSRQTWRLRFDALGLRAVCGAPDARLAFDRGAFADDPRIAAMVWDRAESS